MQDRPNSLGFQVACRLCNSAFVVCQTCWRGQAYCSQNCADAGRRLSLRAAAKRRSKSPEARERARLRQQRSRKQRRELSRQKISTVTHQSTKNLPALVSTTPRARPATSCAFCGQRVRYFCSLEQGRSLRKIGQRIRISNANNRDMGRDKATILRGSPKHQRNRNGSGRPPHDRD